MTNGDKFLQFATDYKKEYNDTPWWKFNKRNHLNGMYLSALDLALKEYKKENLKNKI